MTLIHICMALHDKDGEYSKFTGVSICSVFANTKEKIIVHLFHDDTLNKQNKDFFNELATQYNQEIIFYEVQKDIILNLECNFTYCTIGTLFRLCIAELLPQEIEKIIYLDSDVVVNLNINDLWRINMEKYALAARAYSSDDYWMIRSGLIEKNKYFNAGVLLMNMKYIRNKHNLYNESKNFFKKYPNATFADNDALNFIFAGKVLYLDKKYNTFTILLRNNQKINETAIFHYAGDFVDFAEPKYFDRMFVSYLLQTHWGDNKFLSQSLHKMAHSFNKQFIILQNFLKRITDQSSKKVIFGTSSVMYEKLKTFLNFSTKIDFCVDNNKNLQGQTIDGLKVFSPTVLREKDREEIVVIVLSKAHYSEIKEELLRYGFIENEDFFDGRLLLTQAQGGYPTYK